MSYRARNRSGLAAASIDVGDRAKHDPVLARASLLASEIILKMSRTPESQRLGIVSRELNRLAVGLDRPVTRDYARLRALGRGADQALFDSMRTAIANRLFDRGMQELSVDVASQSGWDALLDSGLGDDVARQAGCVATGAATAIVGTILGVYTGGAGAGIASMGGQLVGGALDCGKEQRAAAAQAAQAQALLAQAEALRAATAARSAAASRRRRLMIGGGVLGTVLVVGFILS